MNNDRDQQQKPKITSMDSIENSQDQKLNNKAAPKKKDEELFLGEKKFRTGLGLFTLLFAIIGLTLSTSSLAEEEATAEILNRSSEFIESGLTVDTDIQLEPRDFEVTGFTNGSGSARMLIWDYLGDSNNEVQILVDGQPIRELHVLNSNVAAYSVPVPSVVTIRGLSTTGAQPITYAVKFPDRKQTLFNAVPTNGVNQYTLVPRF
ncbi:hypothetical protein AB3N04_01385 [Alkalihalophilus sp. As8PL]|uniref:Uncharacterized protein n=1 Tax=Alkalihalophilus sp. As8PL TaxID=3237103 RepID=A0AB39BTB2_9BACI